MTNLYASGQMQTILEVLPVPVVIASSVYQNPHMIYRGNDSDNNTDNVTDYIDLQTLVDGKHLLVISPACEVEERAAHFAHSSIIDDEEALTAALAVHYNWSLATENRPSIALLTKHAPGVQLLSTADILKYWIDTAHPPLLVVRTMLRNMRRRAFYDLDLEYYLLHIR
jgi:hypothetical protein